MDVDYEHDLKLHCSENSKKDTTGSYMCLNIIFVVPLLYYVYISTFGGQQTHISFSFHAVHRKGDAHHPH